MRTVAYIMLAFLGASGSLVYATRFLDGPIGPIRGGPFRSGEFNRDLDVDWAEFSDVRNVELQLFTLQTSRTTNFVVLAGQAFVPCGVVKLGDRVSIGQAFWKTWPGHVEHDARVILRARGMLFELELNRVRDAALHGRLSKALAEKYKMNLESVIPLDEAWFYSLDPRAA